MIFTCYLLWHWCKGKAFFPHVFCNVILLLSLLICGWCPLVSYLFHLLSLASSIHTHSNCHVLWITPVRFLRLPPESSCQWLGPPHWLVSILFRLFVVVVLTVESQFWEGCHRSPRAVLRSLKFSMAFLPEYLPIEGVYSRAWVLPLWTVTVLDIVIIILSLEFECYKPWHNPREKSFRLGTVKIIFFGFPGPLYPFSPCCLPRRLTYVNCTPCLSTS